MSDEPKRFDSVIEMLTHDCHKYALEIARLKAEVDRLRKVFEITERLMLRDGEYEAAKVGTYANLKAEVDRLRKAGDELLENYKTHRVIFPSAVYAWNAAKEGKQS